MPIASTVRFGTGAGGLVPPDTDVRAPLGEGRACRVCGHVFSGRDARFCPFDGESLEAATWDPSGDALLGSVVDGRYEVQSVLGEGGMGTVYRVRHKALERPLALKALRRDLSKDADLPTRFIQEAKAAAAVEHPNVVQITDFGTLPTGQPYFVMELLEGEALSHIIRDTGRISSSRAVGIAIQIAEALGAAHAAGVIHRDLKPDNVNVRATGHHDVVKVLDFGLAKVAGTSRLTRAGMVFGTPHYMSPEQAAGDPSDHRVDIYALGVLLFEMITGRLPFEADSFTGVLAMHMYMEPPSMSALVGAPLGRIEDITLRCLAKKPAERYATMGDLLADLDRAAATLSVPPEPSSRRRTVEVEELPERQARAPASAPRARYAVAALGVALLVAAIFALTRSAPSPAESPSPSSSSQEARAPAGPERAEVAAPPGASADPSPVSSRAAARPPKAPAGSAVKPVASVPAAPPAPPRPRPVGGGGEIIDPWGR